MILLALSFPETVFVSSLR